MSQPGHHPAASREYYIDRLRVVMTALVILHHTAITYGAIGGWFYKELDPSSNPASLLLTMFCSTNQAYFMGFFFLLAGYFTPGPLERKGYMRFLCDRFLRLGLPLLFFILVLGPVTAAIVDYAQGNGFWPTIRWLLAHQRIINGPLWFAQALLIFSLAYAAWRTAFGAALTGTSGQPVPREPRPVPRYYSWLLAALGTAAGSVLLRQFFPVGQNFFGLQLSYFSGYIVLFAVGIAAWRYDWLRQLQWKQARPWIVTLVIAWPCMPAAIVIARSISGPGNANFSSGLSWPAIFYALWEPLIAWGLIALWLLAFRDRMNQPSPLWDWLSRRAYAVYILHPPVLVTVALLLHNLAAPALIKFAITGSLTIAACWLIAGPLVLLPGLRRIVYTAN